MSILPRSPRSSQHNFNVREVQVDDNDPTAFTMSFRFGDDDGTTTPPEPIPPRPGPSGPKPRTLFDSAKIERSDGFFIPRRSHNRAGELVAPYFIPAKPTATTKPATKPQDKPQDAETTVPASVARVCLVEGSWRSEPYRRTADGWRGETTAKTLGFDVIDRAYGSGRVAILSAPAAELDLDELLTRRPGDEPTAEDREWHAKHASNQRGYWVVGEYRRPFDAKRITKYESDSFRREAPRSVRRAAAAGDARGRRRPAGAR